MLALAQRAPRRTTSLTTCALRRCARPDPERRREPVLERQLFTYCETPRHTKDTQEAIPAAGLPRARRGQCAVWPVRRLSFFSLEEPLVGAHTAAETGRDVILVTRAVARSFFLISRSQRVSRYVAESVPIAP